LSIDPVTFLDTGRPEMFNRYSYAFNDPVNLTDPTGECPICPVILGAIWLADKAYGAYDAAQTAKGVAKRSSGRKSYAKPSKPRTGRFNARGRGRSALAAGIGPNRSWQTFDGCNIRYRSRRAIVKVRVMKLLKPKSLLSPMIGFPKRTSITYRAL